MDDELDDAVAGVLLATPTDDLDQRAALALARHVHLAICAGEVVGGTAELMRAARILDDDHGVASVSLLDRSGLAALEAGLDADAAHTLRLTTNEIDASLRRIALPPLSVVSPRAPVVVVSHRALSRIPLFPPAVELAERVAAWSVAASRRALTHLLDLRSILELDDAAEEAAPSGVDLASLDDPAAQQARIEVRVALRGMRVHIDGRTLEEAETGTEVHTLQLIRALALRPEISYVGVNLRGGVPPYAREVLAQPRVNVLEGCSEWSPDLPQVDVFHRPYQPLSREDCELWRAVGSRTACHMQDLITYLSPEYHPSVDAWQRWRGDVSRAVTSVDGVFTLSEYVRNQLLRERMRGEPDLVWAAPCGVDHMASAGLTDPMPAAPPELAGLRRPFALVLGSSYGHKNVDLAVAAVNDARTAGCDIALVTAGRQVGGTTGSAGASSDDTIHLGRNVSSGERNWLLGNAAVVVFATSAEGFGLVPFEAAAFGSPTVCVTFGALAEHLGELPVDTQDWSVAAFSRSIQRILQDRDAATAQVGAIRRAATTLTWDRTAGIVLKGYQEILRRPARG